IQERLLAAGLSGATPVAAVASATLAEQRIATGTLQAMAQMIQHAGIVSPAILVIGEVAREAVEQLAATARSAAA
ncbi:MAG TPA: uroporphyrinogen-III C-methyltransferase, partial [Burkholderiaceae bacterium]|nr:uroporphyrinogen-III C-methyltransferase [Burkholderiaceae bacterium]